MRNLSKILTLVTMFAILAGLFTMQSIPSTVGAQAPTATTIPTPIPPVKANKDWTPVERDFDGVTMVLVPPGCFMMGSTEEQIAALDKITYPDAFKDEGPAHEICFEQPFWIDKYEVTNEQFVKFGGKAGRESQWKEAKRPRESITWVEGHDFCMLREVRLPTEAEWEYAARGPDGLVYPWGNDFVADNVVISENSDSQTAPVGSKPGGKSWVGAFDVNGNVWEWVSNLGRPYPYRADDGREGKNDTHSYRVLRGGSWADNMLFARSAYRFSVNPGIGDYITGFRCARDY